MRNWPDWWSWELELSPHLLKRMNDRQFNEVDLRAMLDDATNVAPNHEPGRWVVTAPRGRRIWEIIVEPVPDDKVLVVVTAYPMG